MLDSDESLENIFKVLNSALHAKIKLIPMKALGGMQGELSPEFINVLRRNDDYSYYVECTSNISQKKKPNGLWIFVVTVDDPSELYCFSMEEVHNDRVCNGIRGRHGHTSLTQATFITSRTAMQNTYTSQRLDAENTYITTKPVYLKDTYIAGEMHFDNGRLKFWNNKSGHYKMPPFFAHFNIPAAIKPLLPLQLYQPIVASKR